MKTKAITFYSYKGGVGRTLLLANMAKQLSDMGKVVCILDFDLEAPGIEYKLQNDSFFIDPPQETRGIVDYVYDFYKTGIKQDFINPTTAITFKKNASNIIILRAGDYKNSSYWSKLSQINWADLFYKENSNGIPFLVELKQTIIDRYKPDYILIDSRTGITEIASLTMSVLADEIVLITSNNDESFDGSIRILNAITRVENNFFEIIPRVNVVLSRIPLPKDIEDKNREEILRKNKLLYINRQLKKLESKYTIKPEDFSVIHSDRDIEWNESLKMTLDSSSESGMSNDYNIIFQKIFRPDFSDEELERYYNISEADKILEKVKIIKKDKNSTFEVIESLLKEVIMKDDSNYEAYFLLGEQYMIEEKFDLAITNLAETIRKYPYDKRAYYFLGFCYLKTKEYQKAISTYNEVNNIRDGNTIYNILSELFIIRCKTGLDSNYNSESDYVSLIEKYPNSPDIYNSYAHYLRIKNKYPEALEKVNKAIELNSGFGLAYATLSEINDALGQEQDFYRNFEFALRFNVGTEVLFDEEVVEIYNKYFKKERFLKLLYKYEQHTALERIKKEFKIDTDRLLNDVV